MENLRNDIRYAMRSLAKKPGFTFIAILTLGLGIGANAAIFSMVNSAVFQPLPFVEPDQLVRVYATNVEQGFDSINVSYPDLTDFAATSQQLERLAAFTRTGVNFTGAGEPERLQAGLVTPGLFEVLRLPPVLGRTITAADTTSGERVAVISESLWRRRFAARADIAGENVILNGRNFTLIGVVPDVTRMPEVWIPLTPTGSTLSRSNRYLSAVGRLKPGVTTEQLQAELKGIAANLETAYPDTNQNHSVRVETLKSALVDAEGKVVFGVLLGFVTFVLAIACANIANLLLAQAGQREKEMAIRASLGAGRTRLVRQLLAESMLLASAGGVLGIGLGYGALQFLLSVLPPFVPRLEEMRMDGWAVAYTAGATLLTGLLCGLAPALQLSRPGLLDTLKQGGQTTGGAGRKRLRSTLAVSQVALALGLLICAGLFLQVFLQMAHLDIGFEPQGVLTFQLSLPPARYDSEERVALAYQDILERVSAVPGVDAVGLTSRLPTGQGNLWRGYMREGDPVPPRRETRHALYYAVSPDYHRAMGIPLIAGRYFEPRDEALEPKVVIINRLLAERLWPGENPVGRRIRIHTDEDFPREIVGVVGDTIYDVEDDPEGQIYVPHRQTTWSTMTVAARAAGDPYRLRGPLDAAIREYDANLPAYSVRSMADIMTEQVQGFRVLSGLMGSLGAVALLMAVMGIYGVVSYSVQQRTREIGVRVALGAQRGNVLGLVLRQGALLAGVGIIIGLGIGAAVNVLLSNAFPELLSLKPWLLAGTASVLGLVAMTACYVPALRATRVSPMEALRYE